MGGNLCNASPAADTAPPLLVLGAEVVLSGKKGARRVPLDSFFSGPGKTALARGEILKEILIPPVPAGSVWAYLKLGRRKSLDLALASVAVLLTLDSEDQDLPPGPNRFRRGIPNSFEGQRGREIPGRQDLG